MGAITLQGRSRILLEDPKVISINQQNGNWVYTTRCSVRGATSGQPASGDLTVEVRTVRPVDPDHPYQVNVPAAEIRDTIESFMDRLLELSGAS